MTKSYILLGLFFLLMENVSFGSADSTNTKIKPALEIAQKMCAAESDIFTFDKLIVTEKANGASWDNISELEDLQDRIKSDHDSLEIELQLAVHNPQADFFYEARKHAWFLYIQSFLHQRGINLNANERFDYVDLLPKEGYANVELEGEKRKGFIKDYMIDSASFFILNRHYPNWKKSPSDRLQKLDLGISQFLELSSERYIPFTAQTELMNCGPTCLKMVLDQLGDYHSLEELAELTNLDENGTSFGDLTRAALQLNMTAENHKVSYEELMLEMDRPVIVSHWHYTHFVVVYAMDNEAVWVADPDIGRIKIDRKTFCENWFSGEEKKTEKGSVLTFKLTQDFYR